MIFKSLFMGLKDVYGTYDVRTGRVRQEKVPVTDSVILDHLRGKQPYGVYLLTGDKTGALVVDFDEDEICTPVSFVAGARRYDISAYVERSKSKGYHAWMFFEEGGVQARKARIVARLILGRIGRPQVEVFPKQDALTSGVSYGNFVNAPLFGALVPEGRTVFVDPSRHAKPYPDQWELLERVQRVTESRLDAVIKGAGLDKEGEDCQDVRTGRCDEEDEHVSPFGLPPCARKMLAEGVSSYQRVSCFRLAVHLKRNGMPYDLAFVTLKAWARKNKPPDGKRIITDMEIENQTKSAFENTYRSFGCEDPAVAAHCDRDCPLYPHTVGARST